MKGTVLVDRLRTKIGAARDSELAKRLGYSIAGIQQIRRKDVTDRGVAEIVSKAIRKTEENLGRDIAPIVEFFPVDSADRILDSARDDHQNLRNALDSCCGLYSFYNSELEVIYIGKTVKRTIWSEMNQVFTQRDMPHYERYKVKHAHGRYGVGDGRVRKISKEEVTLAEAAAFFSAYRIPKPLVTAIETLIIRMIPNDLLNVRMEGNTRLRAHRG